MNDIVLVAFITGAFTLLAGPISTLAANWGEKRRQTQTDEKRENREQLSIISTLLDDLSRERISWLQKVHQASIGEEQRNYRTPPEYSSATEGFRRRTNEMIRSASFHVFNPEVRDAFDTFRTEWDKLSVRLVNHPLPTAKGVERSLVIALMIDSVDIENSCDKLARESQRILIDLPSTRRMAKIWKRSSRTGWTSSTRPWNDFHDPYADLHNQDNGNR